MQKEFIRYEIVVNHYGMARGFLQRSLKKREGWSFGSVPESYAWKQDKPDL